MFIAAALVSSPPLLIPALAGGATAETADLRTACLDTTSELADLAKRWTIVGLGEHNDTAIDSSATGTFAGYGADVRVQLRPDPSPGAPDVALPLAVLIGAWLRGEVGGEVTADALGVAADDSPVQCARLGADLRARLDADPQPWGVLLVADGANTLTERAPGSFDDRAPGVQGELDDALDTGDIEYLRELDAVACADLGIGGRAAYQVLAGLFGDPPSRTATSYRGAPFGVGYHVGMWWP